MTIDQLFADIEAWGPAALLSVADDGSVRVVTVRPVSDGARLRFNAPGRSALANFAVRPTATLYFAPTAQSDGYSLIVDGTATVDPDADTVDVVPRSAVLHRPAP